MGTGTNANAINPKREFPHPRPMAEYMLGPARGRKAPNRQRMAVSPAIADAAYDPHASMKYVWMGAKMPIMPKPKGMRPMIGTIQCTCLSAAHPY